MEIKIKAVQGGWVVQWRDWRKITGEKVEQIYKDDELNDMMDLVQTLAREGRKM